MLTLTCAMVWESVLSFVDGCLHIHDRLLHMIMAALTGGRYLDFMISKIPVRYRTLAPQVAARAPCDVFDPWVRWERGQARISGAGGLGAGAGVRKSGAPAPRPALRVEIWELGNPEIRKSGNPEFWNLEIRKFGIPKNHKNNNSQNQNPFCPKCRQGLD